MKIYEGKIANTFCWKSKKMTKKEDHYLLYFILESIQAKGENNDNNNAEKPQCVGQRCSGTIISRPIR